MSSPPDFTTVLALDANHLDELRAVWPTWMRYRSELRRHPLLLICDDREPCAYWKDSLSFLDHPNARIQAWSFEAADQREKMLSAFVYGAASWVETPWYLKLDTDLAAVRDDDWLKEEWFRPNENGVTPVFVSSPWGYTKPAEMIAKLDQWADGVAELARLPALGLVPQPDSAIIRHPRIISWCFFGRTDWTRQMAQLCPTRLPVPSQDTFLWYCAKRRGDFFRTARMSRVGWSHVSHRRRLFKLCRSVLEPNEESNSLSPTAASQPLTTFRPRGHARSLVQLLKVAEIDPRRGAEIGVLRGGTSRTLLSQYPKLELNMVDTWAPPLSDSPYIQSGDSAARLSAAEQQANYAEALTTTEFASGRRKILRTPSTIAASQIADSSLDFAFIDADHTYEGCSADIRAWWPKIRPGGALTGHDYGALRDRKGYWGVSRAVDEFAAQHRLQVQTWPRRVWAIRKQPSGSVSIREPARAAAEKSAPQIVRILFGDLDAYPKLRREVAGSAQQEWSRRSVVHFVLGTKNYEYLKSLGIEDVRLVDNREEIVPPNLPKLANKPFVLKQVMEQFDEILFVDFDCTVLKTPDETLWQNLRIGDAPEPRTFQALNVSYRRRIVPNLGRNVSKRRCLNTSVVYCAEKSWIDRWVDGFGALEKTGFSFPRNGNDETALIYSLYAHCGFLSSAELVAKFETPIAKLKRGVPEAQELKRREQLYFNHF